MVNALFKNVSYNLYLSISTHTFLKQLDYIQPNTVILSSWLKNQGIPNSLQKKYRASGWLKSM
ncbi:MAG: AbiEi antitoxin N-terminal domain-containing protein [Endomicrobium sp.]|jgi:hypothetical protein|nr:AbiEi antitoxin N-terminal domain-containing protein [Endomicrobium sp.]